MDMDAASHCLVLIGKAPSLRLSEVPPSRANGSPPAAGGLSSSVDEEKGFSFGAKMKLYKLYAPCNERLVPFMRTAGIAYKMTAEDASLFPDPFELSLLGTKAQLEKSCRRATKSSFDVYSCNLWNASAKARSKYPGPYGWYSDR